MNSQIRPFRYLVSFIVVLILQINIIYAQQTIHAKFDENKIQLKNKGVKKGENFKIELRGINTILHRPVFIFKDFELISERPSTLANILPNVPISFSFREKQTTAELKKRNDFLEKIKFFVTHSTKIDSYKNSIIDDNGKPLNSGDIVTNCDKNRTEWIKFLKQEFSVESSQISEVNYLSFTELKISMLIAYYELLYENYKKISEPYMEITTFLSEVKPYYLQLKKVYPIIISGLKATEDGASGNINQYSESLPHYPDKDITNVEIHLINRFNPYDTIASTKADLFIKGKFKIDFSTGPSINTLVQKEYFFTITDSLNTGIAEDRTSDIDLGIAALIHLDWRVGSGFAPGIAVGASISLLDEKPRYILGVSSTIGKAKTFSLVAGANFGNVKVLSKQVSSNGNSYDGTSDLTIFESVPLASKIKWGFFFGMTYNLTRVRK